VDDKGNVTNVRARLTLIGVLREGEFAHDVLLSRSRFLAPAANSLRFYREYFKPASEVNIEKDRLRWLIKYKDTEFYVNLDNVTTPPLGYFLEIKSRTWSRKDAQNKAHLTGELLALLGVADAEVVTRDYIEIVSGQ
jgi:5-methylthioadenosine/S-adenosylhomocysteine deaminase